MKDFFHTHLTDPLEAKRQTGDDHLGDHKSGDKMVLRRIADRNPNFLKTFVLTPPRIIRYYNSGGLADY